MNERGLVMLCLPNLLRNYHFPKTKQKKWNSENEYLHPL